MRSRRAASEPPPGSRPEVRLVARAARGDSDAFATLIRPYDRPLRALAFRLLEDAGAMDDALQDAYVKAFVGLPRFEGASSVGTWLYRILYNTCLDELRRRGRAPALASDEAIERGEPADDAREAVETATDLARALSELPPDQRAAVMLIDAEGMSYDEASEILAVPLGTLASRVNRARARLRSALSEDAP